MLVNARQDSAKDASLAFGSAIVCDLDRMIRDQAIHSVRRFFEDIFRVAEGVKGSDPTWGFSDSMGARVAGSALKRVVLSMLPKNLDADYRRVEHFVVRDVSAESAART